MDINAGIDILPSFLSFYLESISWHTLHFQKSMMNKQNKYCSPRQMETATTEGNNETKGFPVTGLFNEKGTYTKSTKKFFYLEKLSYVNCFFIN